jgi:hypothetical protein
MSVVIFSDVEKNVNTMDYEVSFMILKKKIITVLVPTKPLPTVPHASASPRPFRALGILPKRILTVFCSKLL